jgi:hypothetical protein
MMCQFCIAARPRISTQCLRQPVPLCGDGGKLIPKGFAFLDVIRYPLLCLIPRIRVIGHTPEHFARFPKGFVHRSASDRRDHHPTVVVF